METGADISGWQLPTPNLDTLDFCMIKSTEGTAGTNRYFHEQHDAVISRGIVEGNYHFADGANPIDEANWYMEFTQRVDGQLQALDVEGNFFNAVADPVGWSLTFLQEVEKGTDNVPGIYLSQSQLEGYDWTRVVNNNNWLWIAEWNGQNQPAITQFPVWAMWQYADKSLSGGDADYFNGDIATLKRYAANKSIVIPPAPLVPPTVQYIEPIDLQIPAP